MSIKTITIPSVELKYTPEYIADIFWRQKIAQVKKITMIPYLRNNDVYNIVYIYIETWCDSESAYNFIQRLKDSTKEARLVHNSDDWWHVEINTHNSGDIYLYNYSREFNKDYFLKEEDIKEHENPIYSKSSIQVEV
jgi:hypothetical protein